MSDAVLQRGEVEGAEPGIEIQNGDQQRRRWDEGEEEEFGGGLGSVLAAVHGDEDGHGDERELPEAVVDHEVKREKDAEHRGLLHQEEQVEDLAAFLDGVPTGDNASGCEQADEHHEPEAEAVDAEVIVDGRQLDPGAVDLKLKARLAAHEMGGQMEGETEGEERGKQRDPRGQLAAIGQERNDGGAGKRGEQDQRKN
jgi:hypothetical protein